MSNAEKTPGENSLEKSTIEQLPHVTSDKSSVKFHQEWDYDDLMCGIEELWFELNRLDRQLHISVSQGLSLRKKRIQNTIDFIEYNMREMEITGGNGD